MTDILTPPDGWTDIVTVRRTISDPLGITDFVFVSVLPESGPANAAYMKSNDLQNYWYFDSAAKEWKAHTLRFSDRYISELIDEGGILHAQITLVDNIIMQINPQNYMQSMTAGAQSMGFASLADAMSFYKNIKNNLMAQDARRKGLNNKRAYFPAPMDVGGSYL